MTKQRSKILSIALEILWFSVIMFIFVMAMRSLFWLCTNAYSNAFN